LSASAVIAIRLVLDLKAAPPMVVTGANLKTPVVLDFGHFEIRISFGFRDSVFGFASKLDIPFFEF
jgi:hypothetical protein